MKYFNFYVQSLRGEKSVFQSCNAIFVNKFHYFAVECLKWRPRGIKSLHSGFRGTMYFTRIGSKLKSQNNCSHSNYIIYYCSLLFLILLSKDYYRDGRNTQPFFTVNLTAQGDKMMEKCSENQNGCVNLIFQVTN